MGGREDMTINTSDVLNGALNVGVLRSTISSGVVWGVFRGIRNPEAQQPSGASR